MAPIMVKKAVYLQLQLNAIGSNSKRLLSGKLVSYQSRPLFMENGPLD
jgi:hypothetical protein